jgi:hypothetical protein
MCQERQGDKGQGLYVQFGIEGWYGDRDGGLVNYYRGLLGAVETGLGLDAGWAVTGLASGAVGWLPLALRSRTTTRGEV